MQPVYANIFFISPRQKVSTFYLYLFICHSFIDIVFIKMKCFNDLENSVIL